MNRTELQIAYDRGETFVFEGMEFALQPGGELTVGDSYLAQRNGSVKLLTVEHIEYNFIVFPVEFAYPYDIVECFKVEI